MSIHKLCWFVTELQRLRPVLFLVPDAGYNWSVVSSMPLCSPLYNFCWLFFSPPFALGGTCLGEKADGMWPKTRSTMGKKVLLVGMGVWNRSSNLKLLLLLSTLAECLP